MSKSQQLRALVNKRLIAAAEEIFALFEKTIVEYEEELCRSKEENQRKQDLLDSMLGPKVVLLRAGLQTTSVMLGPDLNQELSALIKEEPGERSFKQEPEQQPVSHSEWKAGVREELSQTEHTEAEARQEDNSTEPHSHSETTNTDTVEDWRAPLSCSGAQIGSPWAEDHYTQVQIRDRNRTAQKTDVSCGLSPRHTSAPGVRVAVKNRDKPGTSNGDDQKKHQCFVCHKKFRSKQHLQTHIRIHTGERPYICSVCNKRFSDHSTLRGHMRTHTGERPFICSFCNKTFAQSANLHSHVRIHTGNKPFSCSTCKKTFARRNQLKAHHMKSHREELSSSA